MKNIGRECVSSMMYLSRDRLQLSVFPFIVNGDGSYESGLCVLKRIIQRNTYEEHIPDTFRSITKVSAEPILLVNYMW